MSFDPLQQASGDAPNLGQQGLNPYLPPQGDVGPAKAIVTRSFEDLRRIARLQQWLMGTVGTQLIFGCGGAVAVAAIAGPPRPGEPPQTGPVLLILGWYLVMFGIQIGTAVLLAMVGNKLWGVAGGVICGVLGFVPCISLITLVIVNVSATVLLQLNGYSVGFLGCNDPRLVSR
jgi:hypothetical protein